MKDAIDSVAALEACIGKTPGAIHLKVIDRLDDGAQRWIATARLAFAAFSGAGGIGITLGGGEPGFARATGPKQLSFSAGSLDEPHLAHAGCGFGGLFLVPGVGETLRINGRVVAANGTEVEVAVDECYVHCAKALIRSDFWNASPPHDVPEDPAGFLAGSRFLALATIDDEGRADVSPKGDPGGMLIRLQEGAACYADRPGNRRADSFRNILAQPRVAVASLTLGSTRVAILSGTAHLTTNEAMRASFAVEGKTPLLATRIERPDLIIRESGALSRARLWPAMPRPDGINAAAILAAHVKLNKTAGLQASLVRAAASIPGLMEKGLQRDYKSNLY